MFFVIKKKLTFPVNISDQKSEKSMDLLHIFDENKSHYLYIKDFGRFMFSKTKNKTKNCFCKSCFQCFSSENVLTEHKNIFLKINGRQAVKLEKGTIEFENLFKQILVPFKIYSDFECILESDESNEGFCSKNIKITISYSFTYKLVCVDDKFSKPVVLYRRKIAKYLRLNSE